MRIGIEQVDKQIDRHLKEGIAAVVERLNLDDIGILVNLVGSHGLDSAMMQLSGIAIGIDIGLEVAAEAHKEVHADVGLHESGHHHDEFLESLPESHPYDLAKSSEPFANQLKRESDERTR